MASALRWLGARLTAVQPERQLHREQARLLHLQQLLLQYLGRLARGAECSGGGASGGGGGGAPADAGQASVQAALGFELSVGPSTIPGAGRGVFITGGCCPAGGILSLYPGLVHDSGDVEEQQAASALAEDACAPAPPPWTVDNHYLLALRCLGRSFLIDGQPFGLSAQLWRRAAAGMPDPPNDSWLPPPGAPWLPTEAMAGAAAGVPSEPVCSDDQQQAQQLGGGGSSAVEQALLHQAALGNLFNHRPGGARFELVPLPSAAVPPALARFLPAVHAGGFDPGLHWVPLVLAPRPVRAEGGRPTEVWVDYGVDAHNLGYHF